MGWVCPLWLISYRRLGHLSRSRIPHMIEDTRFLVGCLPRIRPINVKTDFNSTSASLWLWGKSSKGSPRCQKKALSYEAQTVRLICVTVKKKTYILITSLLETACCGVADFKALYHQRWQIEEVYKNSQPECSAIWV